MLLHDIFSLDIHLYICLLLFEYFIPGLLKKNLDERVLNVYSSVVMV